MRSQKASECATPERGTPAEDDSQTLQLNPSRRLEFEAPESPNALPEPRTEARSGPRSSPPKRLVKDEKPVAEGFVMSIQPRQDSGGVAAALHAVAEVRRKFESGDEKERARIRESSDAMDRTLREKGIGVVEPSSSVTVVLDNPCPSWDDARRFIRYSQRRGHFFVPSRRQKKLLEVAKQRKQRHERKQRNQRNQRKQRKSSPPGWWSDLAKNPLWVCARPGDRKRTAREATFFKDAYEELVRRGFKLPFELPTDPVQMATLVCGLTYFVETLLKQKRRQ